MKQFNVRYPIAGALFFSVEAENEEQAKEKCWEALSKCAEHRGDPISEFDGEWEMLDKIVMGNVCFAPHWEVDVYEEDA